MPIDVDWNSAVAIIPENDCIIENTGMTGLVMVRLGEVLAKWIVTPVYRVLRISSAPNSLSIFHSFPRVAVIAASSAGITSLMYSF